MSEDARSTRSGQTGFGDVAGSSLEEQSTGDLFAEKLRGRWQILLAIGALLLTTVGLRIVDGAMTKDVWVFAILTLLLVAYFVVTFRTDLRMH